MQSGYRPSRQLTVAINLTRVSERATPSISFAESVWSSVFETQ